MGARTGGWRQWPIAAAAAVLVVVLPSPSSAVSATDLPPSLRSLPMDALVSLFSISFEPPSLAAEIARYRALAPPAADDVESCPALGQVIVDYPRTSDARRSLLDIAGVYARKGDWESARAPFLYVMELKEGQPEARVAHLRLIEMYRYYGTPGLVGAVAECRGAIETYAGTDEEGLGRMLLADMLADQGSFEPAFAEFERVIDQFPNQPYSSYARIRYALALVEGKKPERALEVIAPVLADPLWSGRAYYARGRAHERQKASDAAIGDYLKAAQTADSVWFRGEAYLRLARLYAAKGQLRRANECLQACLDVSSIRPDRLDIRLEMMRNLYAAGDPVMAAGMALSLTKEVQNETWRYPDSAIADTVRMCDDLLDECEEALSRGGAAQASSLKGP